MAWWTAALIGLLLIGTLLDYGRQHNPVLTRMTWTTVGFGCLIAVHMGNPWLGVLVALVCLNIWRHGEPASVIPMHLFPALTVFGTYALVAPHMTPAMVVPVLWAMVGTMCLTGLWSVYSLVHRPSNVEGYRHEWYLWGWRFHLYEFSRLEAGHANPNHTQCLAALGLAAGVGLLHLGYWGVAFLLPFSAMPILAVQWENRVGDDGQPPGPTQGMIHVAALGLSAFPMAFGWWGLLVALVTIGFAIPKLLTHSGGRIPVWKQMIDDFWWKQSWAVKLLGTGTGSWIHLHLHWVKAHPQGNPVLFTVAHNEFIQQFVEHGLIGFLALVGFCGTALYALLQAGPIGEAVYFIGATMISVAMIHFPWVLYHEVVIDHKTGLSHGHGSPTLIIWTLILALLIAGTI